LAASAERYSEHPLAEAVRRAATERNLTIAESEQFSAVPGKGVEAHINGQVVGVGSYRILAGEDVPPAARELETEGKTLLYVTLAGQTVGILAASDTMRSDVPAALEAVRKMGITRIELLTGDNERTAAAVAAPLGIVYRANLLPEDKIAIVKQYQAEGHTVVMIGDGVNDAPALAQANIGIAMGVAGTDIAIEAAHVALMREDWSLIPDVFAIAKRTMGVVRFNIGFTIVYNIIGLTLAALGILPPILAAAAQSLPDLGILANSSRLLRYREQPRQADKPLLSRQHLLLLGSIALFGVLVLAIAGIVFLNGGASISASGRRVIEVVLSLVALVGLVGGIVVFVMRQADQVEEQMAKGEYKAGCCTDDTCNCADAPVPNVQLFIDMPKEQQKQ
jgi:P-type Cu+ transporter